MSRGGVLFLNSMQPVQNPPIQKEGALGESAQCSRHEGAADAQPERNDKEADCCRGQKHLLGVRKYVTLREVGTLMCLYILLSN